MKYAPFITLTVDTLLSQPCLILSHISCTISVHSPWRLSANPVQHFSTCRILWNHRHHTLSDRGRSSSRELVEKLDIELVEKFNWLTKPEQLLNGCILQVSRSEDVDLGPGVLRANLLHASASKRVPSQDRLLECFSRNESAQEPARKRVSSAIGIDNLRVRQRVYGVDRRLRLVRSEHNGALRAVREHDCARARRVHLGQERDRLRDRCEVLHVRKPVSRRPRLRLSLVRDDDIRVRQDLAQLRAEKLRDERRGDVQHERLQGESAPDGPG